MVTFQPLLKVLQRHVYSACASGAALRYVFFGSVSLVIIASITLVSSGLSVHLLRSQLVSSCPAALDNIGDVDAGWRLCHDPIDVVYTWVNGSDMVWFSSMIQHRRQWDAEHGIVQPPLTLPNCSTGEGEGNFTVVAGGLQLAPDDVASLNRYRDNDELRYSIRSLYKYAPWVRNVILVTNGQVPSWLDTDHPRVRVVTHSDMYANASHLPVFSSPSIEVHLHRIPGLSNRFVYFNDDVLLGSDTWPDDFFSHAHGQRVYLAWDVPKCNSGCIDTWIGDGYCDAACNTSRCLWDAGDCVNSTKTRAGSGSSSYSNTKSKYDYYSSTNTAATTGTTAAATVAPAPPTPCLPTCPDAWIGDRTCDSACAVEECGWDAGDCGVNSLVQVRPPRAGVDALGLDWIDSELQAARVRISAGIRSASTNLPPVQGGDGVGTSSSTVAWADVISAMKDSLAVKPVTVPASVRSVSQSSQCLSSTVGVEEGGRGSATSVALRVNLKNALLLINVTDMVSTAPRISVAWLAAQRALLDCMSFKANATVASITQVKAIHSALEMCIVKARVFAEEAQGRETGIWQAVAADVGGPASSMVRTGTIIPSVGLLSVVLRTHRVQEATQHELERAQAKEKAREALWNSTVGENSTQLRTSNSSITGQDSPTGGEGDGDGEGEGWVDGFPPLGTIAVWVKLRKVVLAQQAAGQEGTDNSSMSSAILLPASSAEETLEVMFNISLTGCLATEDGESDSKEPQNGTEAGSSGGKATFNAAVSQSQYVLRRLHAISPPVLSMLSSTGGSIPHSMAGLARHRAEEALAYTQGVRMGQVPVMKEGKEVKTGRHILRGRQLEVHREEDRDRDRGALHDTNGHAWEHMQAGMYQRMVHEAWQLALAQLEGRADHSARQARRLADTYADSLVISNRLVNTLFTKRARKVPAHMPHMIDIRSMAKLQEAFPSEFDATSARKFRDGEDIQYAFLYMWFLLEGGARSKLDVAQYFGRELDTDGDGVLSENELRTLASVVHKRSPTSSEMDALRDCLAPPLRSSSVRAVDTPTGIIHEQVTTVTVPHITWERLAACPAVLEGLSKHTRADATGVEVPNSDEVAFEMVSDDYNKTRSQLDSIRARRPKFVCVNDDMKEAPLPVRTLLRDFYASFFPFPSPVELPSSDLNPVLYIGPLRVIRDAEKRRRVVAAAILACVTLAMLLHCCCCPRGTGSMDGRPPARTPGLVGSTSGGKGLATPGSAGGGRPMPPPLSPSGSLRKLFLRAMRRASIDAGAGVRTSRVVSTVQTGTGGTASVTVTRASPRADRATAGSPIITGAGTGLDTGARSVVRHSSVVGMGGVGFQGQVGAVPGMRQMRDAGAKQGRGKVAEGATVLVQPAEEESQEGDADQAEQNEERGDETTEAAGRRKSRGKGKKAQKSPSRTKATSGGAGEGWSGDGGASPLSEEPEARADADADGMSGRAKSRSRSRTRSRSRAKTARSIKRWAS